MNGQLRWAEGTWNSHHTLGGLRYRLVSAQIPLDSGASRIALVIEAADSTLERDRTSQKRLYARSGMPIYWIINLSNRAIEIYIQPENEDYQQQMTDTE